MNNWEHQIHPLHVKTVEDKGCILKTRHFAVFLRHSIVTSAYNKSDLSYHVVSYRADI